MPLEGMWRWVLHFIIGVVVGTIAYYMTRFEDALIHLQGATVQVSLNNGHSVWAAYVNWTLFALVAALIAVLLTVYIGPGAMGSGVPEVMGLLNGVRYPKALDLATFFIKIIGVEFAVIGNLAIGKEGPLVHIGAIVGAMSPYIPLDVFAPFRNDSDKRTLLAAGAAAGVSSAFGAPIGGALFVYEISKPNTFWTFSMLWRVFFSCAIATLVLGMLEEMAEGLPLTVTSSAVLKFGEVTYFDAPFFDLVIAIVLGAISGLLGAFFVYVYAMMGFFRKNYVNTGPKRVLEVLVFSFVSSSLFYWASAGCKKCFPIDPTLDYNYYFRFTCPENEYNPQATLFLNTEGAVIRALMNVKIKDTVLGYFIFTSIWYVLMITTAGVFVPAGLFLPGMLVGAGLGIMLRQGLAYIEPNQEPLLGSSYQIMGAAAMMAGYTRQTYSLAVIMLETSQTVNFFIPVLLTIMVSVGVGSIFNRSLYERSLRSKNIPMLRNHIPKTNRNVTAFQIMSSPVVTVEPINTV